MNLLFFGTPLFAVPSLQVLLAGSHRLRAVLTQPARPSGRGRSIHQPSAVAQTARSAGIPVLEPERLEDARFLEELASLRPDVGVVVAYGRILPPPVLKLFRKGLFNAHASLLPRFRGASPIARAIVAGDGKTGITIFRLDEEIDHGPILLQTECPIDPEEDAASLGEKLSRLAAESWPAALELLERDAPPLTPQDESKATLAPPLQKADGIIRWEEDCGSIHRLVRAVQPWPGALTWLGARMIKLLRVHADPRRHEPALPAGTVAQADAREGLWIQTGRGQIRVDRLQVEGANPLETAEFLRGHRWERGTRLQSRAEAPPEGA